MSTSPLPMGLPLAPGQMELGVPAHPALPDCPVGTHPGVFAGNPGAWEAARSWALPGLGSAACQPWLCLLTCPCLWPPLCRPSPWLRQLTAVLLGDLRQMASPLWASGFFLYVTGRRETCKERPFPNLCL